MGMVPKETKAQNKQVLNLSLNMIFGIIMTMMLSQSFGNILVHPKLNLPFMIVCIALYLLVNRPAPNAPNRKLWQGWLIWMSRIFRRKKYKSIIGYEYMEAKHAELEQKTKHGKTA